MKYLNKTLALLNMPSLRLTTMNCECWAEKQSMIGNKYMPTEIPGNGLSTSAQYFECGKGQGQSQPEEAWVEDIRDNKAGLENLLNQPPVMILRVICEISIMLFTHTINSECHLIKNV